MKHKQTLRRGLSILLSLVLCLGLLPATALAEGEDAEVSPKAIQLGADCISGYDSETGYDYLYYGYWNSDDTKAYSGPIKWRVLDTKTNMDGAKEGDGLFLLSDDLLCESSSAANQLKVSYHRDSDNNSESYGKYYRGKEHEGGHENCQLGNEWQGSSTQAWCQAFYSGSLTAQEQSAVLATTKSDEELSYTARKINGNGEGYVDEYYVVEYAAADDILNREKVFFLSAEEAVTAAYGFAYGSDGDSARKTATSNYWSLRSPAKSAPGSNYEPTGCAGAINSYGQMYMQSAVSARPLMTTRPAFNLDPDAVLFTSAVEGGKNADGMNGSLTAVADYTGHEWKLTLKDSDRSDFTASVTARSDDMVMVEYENAITGANEFISAIVIDEDGNISYYGRIAQPTGAGGRVYFTLPEGFNEDTDTLFVFNEQYNGAQMTDCASDLVEVALTGDLPSLSVFNRAIRIGSDDIYGYDQINGYSYLYFGNWEAPDKHTTTGPIKWLVLDDQTNTGADGLFLLSEAVLGSGDHGNVYFNQSSHKADGIWYKGAEHDGGHENCQLANAWQGSDGQAWCRDFYGRSLTEQEQAAVLATTKSDGEYYGSYPFNILYSASDDILKDDTVFFLSTEEAENGAYGFPDNASRSAVYDGQDTRWWLRSPVSEETATVGVVHTKGVVASWTVYSNWAARPAFNLDPDAVVFASAAEGGKSASGLASVGDYTGNEWKLTLLDSDRSGFTASTETVADNKVTIAYSNATTGSNEYISAIVRDEYGSVSYYGRIAQLDGTTNTASGTVEIDLSGINMTGKTLCVFNEQYNGDKMTDYASALCTLSLPKPISGCTVDPIPNQSYADGAPLTPAVTVRDGDVTLTEGTDYTVFYKNNVDVGKKTAIVTITGKGDYTGEKSVRFNIVPLDITTMAVTQEGCTYGETLPDYTLLRKPNSSTSETALYTGTLAKDNSAYSSAEKPTEAGSYTVTVFCETPDTNFKATASFTIDPRSIEDFTVTLSDTELAYTGDSQSVTVTAVGNLAAGDYEASGTSGTNAGEYTVTVTGKGNYTGTATAPWRITKIDPPVPTGVTGIKGKAVSTVRLPNGWWWNDPAAILDASGTFKVSYTDKTGNYNNVSGVDVTVTLVEGYTVTAYGLYGDTMGIEPGETYTEIFAAGDEVGVQIGKRDGYKLKDVTLVGITEDQLNWSAKDLESADRGFHFSMPENDVTVTVNWEKTSGSSSGGSGGGSSSPSYSVTVDKTVNGTVTVSPKSASKGSTVTLTVTPDKGYTLETLTVTDGSGDEIELTNKGDGKYTFTMPASKVTVKATFMEDNSMLNFFVDVPADAYYYDAVLWAAENGITGGVDDTHFAPNATCTRAQAVTFLWRAAGSPAPKSSEMPFEDVVKGSYYYDAVLWAVENGITDGTSATTFSPNAVCSRGQIVTFLWRSQKSPASDSVNPFTDVAADAYYNSAVLWAVTNGITDGTSATTFSPAANCTRAQIVTFLYRCLGEE